MCIPKENQRKATERILTKTLSWKVLWSEDILMLESPEIVILVMGCSGIQETNWWFKGKKWQTTEKAET